MDPEHRTDNRWLHRPRMDWEAAGRRRRRGTIEGRIHADLRRLIAARRQAPQIHAAVPLDVLDTGDPALFAFGRDHPIGALVSVSNFADAIRADPRDAPAPPPRRGCSWTCSTCRGTRPGEPIEIPRTGVRWLVSSDATARTPRRRVEVPRRDRRRAALPELTAHRRRPPLIGV